MKMNPSKYTFARLSKVYHCKATELQISKVRGMKLMPMVRDFDFVNDKYNILTRYLMPDDYPGFVDSYERLFDDSKNSEEKLGKMLNLREILFGDIQVSRGTSEYPVQDLVLRLNQQYTDGNRILSFWYMMDDDFGGQEFTSDKHSKLILNNMITGYDTYGENIQFILVAPPMNKCTNTIYSLVKDSKSNLKYSRISVVPSVSMLINPLKHSLSSNMRILGENEKDILIRIMADAGIEISKFPKLFSSSIDAKFLGAVTGDIIEITDSGPMTNTMGTKRFRLVIDKISDKAPNQYGKMMES